MSTMEQALRDEIAWHEAEIEYLTASEPYPAWRLWVKDHRARLAALTAALPAPGVEAPGDWVMVPRVLSEEMRDAAHDIGIPMRNGSLLHLGDSSLCALYAAMIAAAPSAPAEIRQDKK